MLHRFAVALFLLCGCRELTIPAKGTGRVSGICTYTDERGLTVPAAGAVAVIAGTTLRAVATDEGAFALEPITSTTGQLILSLDVDGDGAVELSRALDFSAWNIGPNHETSLGSISLRSTATITGTVLLPAASAASSAGSTVFVPGLPLATITSDTGAFVLSGVPEGTFSLAAAHTGYVTARLEGHAARAAEVLELAPISLSVGQPQPATLKGTVALVPAGDLTTVTVTLLGVAGTTPLASNGAFSLSAAPGAVTVVVQAPGYSDGVLANVLAGGGTTVDLGTVRLTAGSYAFDAGTVPTATDPLCGNGLVDPGRAATTATGSRPMAARPGAPSRPRSAEAAAASTPRRCGWCRSPEGSRARCCRRAAPRPET